MKKIVANGVRHAYVPDSVRPAYSPNYHILDLGKIKIEAGQLNRMLGEFMGSVGRRSTNVYNIGLRFFGINIVGSEPIRLPWTMPLDNLWLDISNSSVTTEQFDGLVLSCRGNLELDLQHWTTDSGPISIPEGVKITRLHVSGSNMTQSQFAVLLQHYIGDRTKLDISGCKNIDAKTIMDDGDAIQERVPTLKFVKNSTVEIQQLNKQLENYTGEFRLDLSNISIVGKGLINIVQGATLTEIQFYRSNITMVQINHLLTFCKKGPLVFSVYLCNNLGHEMLKIPKGIEISELHIMYSSITAPQLNELLLHLVPGNDLELDISTCTHIGIGDTISIPARVRLTSLIIRSASSVIQGDALTKVLTKTKGQIVLLT